MGAKAKCKVCGDDVEGAMDTRLKCLICGKMYRHLGSHLYHTHQMKAHDYKARFELPFSMPLVTDDIADKQRESAEKYKAHVNFKKIGRKFQFKKGHTGQRRISEHERRAIIERINEVNRRKKKVQQCPVCRIYFKHVESHMYRVHGLIKVKLPERGV